MVERSSLLNCCAVYPVPRVRIPVSPPTLTSFAPADKSALLKVRVFIGGMAEWTSTFALWAPVDKNAPYFLIERRGARVDEWDSLENCRAFTGSVGSNPTLSALLKNYVLHLFNSK